MYRFTIAAGLLIGSSALGWGCAPEQEQTSASVGKPVPDVFVPSGPVQTEQEAVATAWRYMLAHYDDYLAPDAIEMPDGTIRYSDIRPATIDTREPPRVTQTGQNGAARWLVAWDHRYGGTGGGIGFAIDRQTGQTERLEPTGM